MNTSLTPRLRADLTALLDAADMHPAPLVTQQRIDRTTIESERQMQAAWAEYTGTVQHRPLRLRDRLVIGAVLLAGCACWAAVIWYAARGGVWWS